MTAHDIPAVAYKDADGNTYRVEKASNGMWVCVRINPGNNRKGFAPVGADRRCGVVQTKLDAWASEHKWKEIKA